MLPFKGYLVELFREATVYGVALALRQLGSLLLWPFYARVFSLPDLGNLALALSYQGLLAILTTFSMDSAAFRWFWDREDPAYRARILANWLFFQVSASVLALLATAILALEVLDRPTGLLFVTAAFALLFSNALGILAGFFRMARNSRKFLILNVWQVTLQVLITALLTATFRSPVAVFLAQVLSAAVVLGAYARFWQEWLRTRVEWFTLTQMLRYALPLSLSSLALWLLSLGDRFLVERLLGLEATGVFHLGNVLAMVVAFPVLAFQQAWGPFALSLMRNPQAQEVYVQVGKWFVAATTLIAFLLGLILPPLAPLIFGGGVAKDGFAWASPLFLAQVYYGLYFLVAVDANLAKDNRPIALGVWLGGVTKVLLALLLTPMLGIGGMAWATMAGYAVAAGYLMWAPVPFLRTPFPRTLLFGLPLLASLGLALLGR